MSACTPNVHPASKYILIAVQRRTLARNRRRLFQASRADARFAAERASSGPQIVADIVKVSELLLFLDFFHEIRLRNDFELSTDDRHLQLLFNHIVPSSKTRRFNRRRARFFRAIQVKKQSHFVGRFQFDSVDTIGSETVNARLADGEL